MGVKRRSLKRAEKDRQAPASLYANLASPRPGRPRRGHIGLDSGVGHLVPLGRSHGAPRWTEGRYEGAPFVQPLVVSHPSCAGSSSRRSGRCGAQGPMCAARTEHEDASGGVHASCAGHAAMRMHQQGLSWRGVHRTLQAEITPSPPSSARRRTFHRPSRRRNGTAPPRADRCPAWFPWAAHACSPRTWPPYPA